MSRGFQIETHGGIMKKIIMSSTLTVLSFAALFATAAPKRHPDYEPAFAQATSSGDNLLKGAAVTVPKKYAPELRAAKSPGITRALDETLSPLTFSRAAQKQVFEADVEQAAKAVESLARQIK